MVLVQTVRSALTRLRWTSTNEDVPSIEDLNPRELQQDLKNAFDAAQDAHEEEQDHKNRYIVSLVKGATTGDPSARSLYGIRAWSSRRKADIAKVKRLVNQAKISQVAIQQEAVDIEQMMGDLQEDVEDNQLITPDEVQGRLFDVLDSVEEQFQQIDDGLDFHIEEGQLPTLNVDEMELMDEVSELLNEEGASPEAVLNELGVAEGDVGDLASDGDFHGGVAEDADIDIDDIYAQLTEDGLEEDIAGDAGENLEDELADLLGDYDEE